LAEAPANLIDATTSIGQDAGKNFWRPSRGNVRSGHGDVATPADVHDFHDYLVTLRDDIAKAQAAGKSGQDLTDAVLPQLKEKYGAWGFFDAFSKRNIPRPRGIERREKSPVPQSDAASHHQVNGSWRNAADA